MGSLPKGAQSTAAASAHRVDMFFHHLRSAIDVLQQIAHEELVDAAPSRVAAAEAGAVDVVSNCTDKLSFFTIKEVVSLLRVGRTTIYAALAQNKLKAVKLGSRTLIPRDELRSWVATFPAR